MASQSWTIDLPERRHQIDADFGYWFAKAMVRVDGRTVSASRPLLRMSFEWGLDIPVDLDGHALVVSIRPVFRRFMIVTGYRFWLSVDGTAVDGTDPIPPLKSVNGGSGYSGPRLVETAAWASVGGGVIGLYQHGEHPSAFLFGLVPAACSFVTRRPTLSTRQMALICFGIIIAGIAIVAAIGAATGS